MSSYNTAPQAEQHSFTHCGKAKHLDNYTTTATGQLLRTCTAVVMTLFIIWESNRPTTGNYEAGHRRGTLIANEKLDKHGGAAKVHIDQ